MLEAGTGNMNSFENLTLLQKMLVRWTGTEDRRLLIEFHEGAWNITESTFPHDTYHTARGTGVTFDAAWENMRQTWIP
jgi:hypothetical protein